jgi:integrase
LSLREFAAQWLSTKAPELAPTTLHSYRGGVSQLLSYLGPRADAPLTEISKADVLAYRNHLSTTLSARTVNSHLTLLRMLFKSARRDGVLADNPAEFVGSLKSQTVPNKRPFTLPELQAVLAVADDEWRSLILFGLYTDQRLSDLASLSWSNIDLGRDEVRLVTRKTGRTMVNRWRKRCAHTLIRYQLANNQMRLCIRVPTTHWTRAARPPHYQTNSRISLPRQDYAPNRFHAATIAAG